MHSFKSSIILGLQASRILTCLFRVFVRGEYDAGTGIGDVILERLLWVRLAERDGGDGQRAGPDAEEGGGEGGAVGGEDAHTVPALPLIASPLLEESLQAALHHFAYSRDKEISPMNIL